jgi:hypothetical protein
MTTYKNKFSELSTEALLQLGVETGKELLETSMIRGRLDNEKRKIIHRVLQLLKIPYVSLSDYQKCQLLYVRYLKIFNNLECSNVKEYKTDECNRKEYNKKEPRIK